MRDFKSYLSKSKKEDPTPYSMSYPVLLMCPPFNLSSGEPNNIFMKKLAPNERKVDKNKAMRQFLGLYNYVSDLAMVYLIPHVDGLQDQSFVANLGIVLPHFGNGKTVVISEFKSPPRVEEQRPGVDFFHMLGYDVRIAPKYFEGEADLKYFNNNNYIGAYGIRTSIDALNWFEREFDMNVVKVENTNEQLYHLDCCVYQLYSNKCLAVTSMLSSKNKRDIEKFAEIIPLPKNIDPAGVTNCIGLYKTLICASNIDELKVTDENYKSERDKVDFLTKVCAQHSLEPIFFNLSEYSKNGADLSCMFMHLNYSRMMEILD